MFIHKTSTQFLQINTINGKQKDGNVYGKVDKTILLCIISTRVQHNAVHQPKRSNYITALQTNILITFFSISSTKNPHEYKIYFRNNVHT